MRAFPFAMQGGLAGRYLHLRRANHGAQTAVFLRKAQRVGKIHLHMPLAFRRLQLVVFSP